MKVILLEDRNMSYLQTELAKLEWKAAAASGRPLEVVIRPESKDRTKEQNALFWVYMDQLAEFGTYRDANFDHGHTFQLSKNAWAEIMRRRFLGTERLPNGDLFGRSTRDLTTREFADFLTQIEQVSETEYGWQIRERDEVVG